MIGINKWDLAERSAGAIPKLREQADHGLPQVKGVPVVGVSGLTGEGLDRRCRRSWKSMRPGTAAPATHVLNRWLEARRGHGATAAR